VSKMKNETRLGCLLFCFALLLGGCSSEPAPPSPPPEIAQAPAPEEPASPPAESPPAPGEPGIPAAETPAPSASPPSPPAPAPDAAPGVVDPGGMIEVAATKPGLSRIGPEKCKMCHKVQFASWAETAHAARTPPLDCESCHGPGSEYKNLAIMKDPGKARSAGLVMPDGSFCSQCHRSGWTEEMLSRAHAHKAETS